MLRYLRENPVQYVIVHKVDRLARSRADDVVITMEIKKSGATLVSCSENIDETPSGLLLHGIMSSIAEFYSRNLATEVTKGTEPEGPVDSEARRVSGAHRLPCTRAHAERSRDAHRRGSTPSARRSYVGLQATQPASGPCAICLRQLTERG